MTHPLVTLFKSYSEMAQPPIIELLDINQKSVGALYLDKLRYKDFIVSDTNNSEKYYLYYQGLGIYFSFFRKIKA